MPVLAAGDRDYNETNSKGVLINKRERFYNFGEVGAKINGFVGYTNNGNKKIGQYGLEQYFNNELDRQNILGSKNYFFSIFNNNNISELMENNNNIENYGDIYTTIDENVQNYLYLLLKDIHKQ
ncbi:MAG: hypothetical protein QM532_04375 [Cyanobium sp. MAG06]|nr:hypothetical protein [Cyanobium sp. MAG06]